VPGELLTWGGHVADQLFCVLACVVEAHLSSLGCQRKSLWTSCNHA
jgi:hypothetical protein